MKITINLPEWMSYIAVTLIVLWSVDKTLLLIKKWYEWRLQKTKNKTKENKNKSSFRTMDSKEVKSLIIKSYSPITKPEPPKPPLGRTIRLGVGIFCKNCNSTMSKRRFLRLFGKRYCDNKKCPNNKSEKNLPTDWKNICNSESDKANWEILHDSDNETVTLTYVPDDDYSEKDVKIKMPYQHFEDLLKFMIRIR